MDLKEIITTQCREYDLYLNRSKKFKVPCSKELESEESKIHVKDTDKMRSNS